jgi:uncharacterized protein YndB with AHSA1/START domain
MEHDDVFKALADDNRRLLLDLLFQRDGQTLSELCAHLPMSRYGCMKHLQVLEDAGLVTTQKAGREKFHYLNPVPIQLVYDRWVSKYAQPYAQTLSALKNILEETPMSSLETHVFQIFIRTTPEKLWQAVTDGDFTQHYYFGTRVESTWQPGAPYTYSHDGGLLLEGEVLEVNPPQKLVTTFVPHYVPGAEALPPSKVTFEIEPRGDLCKLTVTHAEIDPANPASPGMVEGWAMILSGLKTLLETGEPIGM